MKRPTKMARSGSSILAATVALVPLALAADEAYVDYRQQLMQAVGGHAGAIGIIVKSRLPEPEAIVLHAEAVAATADTVPAAFSAELYEGPTDSKPEIWQNMDDFLALNEKMREASLALAETARGGDVAEIRRSMRTFTKSCGACHQDYRKPKEESYRQRR